MNDRRARCARLGVVISIVVSLAAPAASVGRMVDSEKVVSMQTVVMLHGLARSARNMLILKWRLQARGYRVCNIDYDTRVRTIEHAVDSVHEALGDCHSEDSRLNFVTHSLGGLVLRGLLARHEFASLGRAVMLAPPNSGSEIADRFRHIRFVNAMLGPLARQLGTRPEDIPRRLPSPSIPFGVIAGNRWINPAGPIWLSSPHDGSVSVKSTRLEGMDDHIVLPYTHTFIMNPAVVANEIDHFLRVGRFARSEADGAD